MACSPCLCVVGSVRGGGGAAGAVPQLREPGAPAVGLPGGREVQGVRAPRPRPGRSAYGGGGGDKCGKPEQETVVFFSRNQYLSPDE